MTRPPMPPAGVPTLIVVGTQSWVPIERIPDEAGQVVDAALASAR
jgi:hypothetical protein